MHTMPDQACVDKMIEAQLLALDIAAAMGDFDLLNYLEEDRKPDQPTLREKMLNLWHSLPVTPVNVLLPEVIYRAEINLKILKVLELLTSVDCFIAKHPVCETFSLRGLMIYRLAVAVEF